MPSAFFQDFDGTIARRDYPPLREWVWHPSAGQWSPWPIDPFAVTEITEADAQAIAGPGMYDPFSSR